MLARSSTDLERKAATLGAGALGVSADVTDPAEVARAVAHVEETWGPVDLLVHNAGSAKVVGPLWQADPDAWWDEVAVHVRGGMLLARACLPSMIARGTGRVVLVYGNLGDRASRGVPPMRPGRPGC